ncbi:DUF1906 domain-containing protein [Corynebacterium atypicum]|uniref:DUF1906 domain-containing protein n=1 Tax=Corynebacterium atypicum TaxID=191610 RepID=UPI0009FED5FF|nr:DUF1906 domain-containing protein [Corynebacterium atypicum]
MDLRAPISRRSLFKATAATAAFGAAAALAPRALAQPTPLGTVVDYSAGVPSAQAVKAAGHLGAVRYVSRARSSWMKGKPVSRAEAEDYARNGLAIASVYQYSNSDRPDWHEGAKGAEVHAPQAIALHLAAGGPAGRPIYMAIDANPTRTQYENQIRPFLSGCRAALAVAGLKLGIYGNYHTIQWAIDDGLGEYFWMHNWGSNGKIHPRANLHQFEIDKRWIARVGIDRNHVFTQDWGQWTPGSTIVAPTVPAQPGGKSQTHNTNSTPGDINQQSELASLIGGSSDMVLPRLDTVTVHLPGGGTISGAQLKQIAEQAARLSS